MNGVGPAAEYAPATAPVTEIPAREEAAKETVAMAEDLPGRILSFKADVAISSEVQGYVAKAMAKFGNLRFFHNNAGVEGVHKSIVDISEEQWDMMMNINLRSYFLGLKYVLPVMKASEGGAIVITASIAGLRGQPNRSDYVVPKHALIGLTRCAAIEHAKDGIKINGICPGPIEGPLMARSERLVNPRDPGFERRRFEEATPVGRYGQPDEVADLVTYLLSPRVSYLTGAIIAIDGGITAD